MKTKKIISMAALLFAALPAAQAQFTAGDLVVLQDGNGGATLTSAGTAIFLDDYNITGDLESTLAIPSTGSAELVNSGTASSEGDLTLSANNQYLVLAGYNVAAGTTGVAGAASSAVSRGVATVDAGGNYTLAATTSTAYSGNNIRGATSDGSGNYWGAGAAATGGTVYMGTGTPAQISSVNSTYVQDAGGNLFYSTAKGTTGVYEIPGTPTSGTATPTLVLPDANPSAFAFNSSMTVAYVADTSAGIERYSFNGTAWVLNYTLDSGTGINGLAVNFSGANPEIFATTESGKHLIEITDTGSGSTATTLASVDGTTEAFRGLSFAPGSSVVPEPSVIGLLGLGFAGLYGKIRRSRKI
jgi:hypothetical protein